MILENMEAIRNAVDNGCLHNGHKCIATNVGYHRTPVEVRLIIIPYGDKKILMLMADKAEGFWGHTSLTPPRVEVLIKLGVHDYREKVYWNVTPMTCLQIIEDDIHYYLSEIAKGNLTYKEQTVRLIKSIR